MPTHQPVIPTSTLTRKVGVEVELSVGQAGLSLGRSHRFAVPGWVGKDDGSLGVAGTEYVLAEPTALGDLLPKAKALESMCGKISPHKAGSTHVHVQLPDANPVAVANRLYVLQRALQLEIDKLVPPSRRGGNNTYCKRLPDDNTAQVLFEMGATFTSREDARSAACGRYFVINFAMARVTAPDARSVEFRQQGPSARAVNVVGWATLCAALVEAAAQGLEFTELDALCAYFDSTGETVGLAAWVAWRREHLNAEVTEEMVDKVVNSGVRSVDIFKVAKLVDGSAALAKNVVDHMVHEGLATQVGNRVRLKYNAQRDMALLTAAMSPRLDAVAAPATAVAAA